MSERIMLVMCGCYISHQVEVLNKMISSGDLAAMVPAGYIHETLEVRLQKLIKQKDIMLFMKGVPESPECGFSKKLVAILKKYEGSVIPEYGHFNILTDNDVREGLKKLSKWPTYPQLYAKGQLIGGIDIVTELDEEGELEDALLGN